MTDSLFKLPGYLIKYLRSEDTIDLRTLLEKCADYSLLVTGSLPKSSAAPSLLVDRPDGKTLDDKFVFGIFTRQKELIGVLDVLRDYPAQHDWWLGLLLFDPRVRGQGLGQRVYGAFEQWVSRQGARCVYLGVVEENHRAYQFWQMLGFEEVKRHEAMRAGNAKHVVIVMLRVLTKKSTGV